VPSMPRLNRTSSRPVSVLNICCRRLSRPSDAPRSETDRSRSDRAHTSTDRQGLRRDRTAAAAVLLPLRASPSCIDADMKYLVTGGMWAISGRG
jgi:hypothetical protein